MCFPTFTSLNGYAPINVKPQGGRATHGKLTECAFPWVGILTLSVAPGSGI